MSKFVELRVELRTMLDTDSGKLIYVMCCSKCRWKTTADVYTNEDARLRVRQSSINRAFTHTMFCDPKDEE